MPDLRRRRRRRPARARPSRAPRASPPAREGGAATTPPRINAAERVTTRAQDKASRNSVAAPSGPEEARCLGPLSAAHTGVGKCLLSP